jgi:hypothetical protein
MLAVILLLLGVASRLIIHFPNFTPVIALALFGGIYLKQKQALLLPLLLLAVTDLILGSHQTMLFTWGSVLLISLIGFKIRKNKTFFSVVGVSFVSAIMFFVITNFGVWLVAGLYPRTAAGLLECFMLAIPFFRNTLASTVIYTMVFAGVYELLAANIRKTELARVLL